MGIIFGFILQRGRFCFYSAIRDPLLLKDTKLLKGVGLAIAVEMIGFAFLVLGDASILSKKQLFWLPQIIGGVMFGIGMVWAAGCASGTTYRVGEGMMGSFVALLGLTLGVYMVKPGGILNGLMSDMLAISPKTSLTIGGEYAWILMLVIGIIAVVLVVWKEILPSLKAKKEKEEKANVADAIFKKPWKWWVAGIALGVLAIVSFGVFNNLLGITGHWWKVGTALTDGATLTLGAYMVIGIIIGGFISAKIAGEFSLRAPKDGKILIMQWVGGVFMGTGAAFAGGCNIGNILSGVPLLSVGSILVTICIFGGCWLMTYLMFMRGD
ncbi:MAG: YeeE/YedE family protein [Candidatus Lokiarchaeota archaeon]|nr:YeeE/YedE family protein [Candidatus Lokiarchaeota archaeon]